MACGLARALIAWPACVTALDRCLGLLQGPGLRSWLSRALARRLPGTAARSLSQSLSRVWPMNTRRFCSLSL